MGSRRTEVRLKVDQYNSLYYWWKVKNPLLIILNFLVIFIFRYSPSLRLKNLLYRAIGAKIGKGASLALSVVIDVFFPELIEIGENTILGYNTTILTHEFLIKEFRTGKVKIGKNVLVGAYSLVLAGVEIGDNTTVAAYSLVNKDLPPNAFAAGVPARVIRFKDMEHDSPGK
ncbi:MAG: acyltransferase [Atribacterota bacterium]